ncbi:hypothetical protein NLJ89_g8039 [Agrocybe chaxingu]|uniref:CxC5 like cysteine cluster associated with KDZ domain-containing protein n=1 Tax=Agrocybe chaxingu TaxID=84603 RepID=A0A9W8JVZ6_9AGAR|nr:hypothetical protein NLJ89_g8039 [Agrocybe chaxingu]
MLPPPLTVLCILVVRWVLRVESRPDDTTATLAALLNTRLARPATRWLQYTTLTSPSITPIQQAAPSDSDTGPRWSIINQASRGPIFLTTPGESNAESGFAQDDLTNASIHGTLAQSNGGAIVLLEHRYYGESLPAGTKNYKNATTLKYNTIDQAIEDIVYFAQNVNCRCLGAIRRASDRIGGLGFLQEEAMLALCHPGVFWAGYSSSGVVQPIADFWEYVEPTHLHMAQNCSTDVQRLVAYVDKLYDTQNTTGIEDLNNRLGSSPDADILPTVGSSLFYKFCDRLEVLEDGSISGADGWGIDQTIAGLRKNVEDVPSDPGWGEAEDLLKITTFIKYAPKFKDDIFLVQDSKWPAEQPPPYLPQCILDVLSHLCEASILIIEQLWDLLKDIIWDDEQREAEINDRFNSVEKNLGYYVLYPPTHFCTNENCDRHQKAMKLQKVEQNQGVLYMCNGIFPVWVMKLFCLGEIPYGAQ